MPIPKNIFYLYDDVQYPIWMGKDEYYPYLWCGYDICSVPGDEGLVWQGMGMALAWELAASVKLQWKRI